MRYRKTLATIVAVQVSCSLSHANAKVLRPHELQQSFSIMFLLMPVKSAHPARSSSDRMQSVSRLLEA